MRRRWRVLVWRYRYVLAAGLAAIIVTGLVRELRPPPPGEVIVVAAVDLPAGEPITAAQITTTRAGSTPSGLADDPVGHSPVVTIPAGHPIAETMLLTPEFSQHAPPGTVIAPVHVADPAVLTLLEVGHRVDLYSAVPGGGDADLVASGARVLAIPQMAGGLFNDGEHKMFLAAIRESEASLFTGASALAPFHVVISPAWN